MVYFAEAKHKRVDINIRKAKVPNTDLKISYNYSFIEKLWGLQLKQQQEQIKHNRFIEEARFSLIIINSNLKPPKQTKNQKEEISNFRSEMKSEINRRNEVLIPKRK